MYVVKKKKILTPTDGSKRSILLKTGLKFSRVPFICYHTPYNDFLIYSKKTLCHLWEQFN